MQLSLVLSSTLYSNTKFILDRKYFQIIMKKIDCNWTRIHLVRKRAVNHFVFFNENIHICLTPSPSYVRNYLFLAEPPPPHLRCGNHLWMVCFTSALIFLVNNLVPNISPLNFSRRANVFTLRNSMAKILQEMIFRSKIVSLYLENIAQISLRHKTPHYFP